MGLADLHLFLWNVHGLQSTVGVLQATAQQADILVLTETWSNPGVPGCTSFSCFRPSQNSQGRPSGGLACFVRLPLASYVSIWRVAQDASLLWLRLDKRLGLHNDLYVCAAYVAPKTSTHYDRAASVGIFDQLLSDLADAQALGDVLLAGDFNARTGTGADFVDRGQRGQSPEGELPLPTLPTGLRQRLSQDHGAISPFGRSLLDLCCSANMLIMNGRVAGDIAGKLTFPHPQGGSVVDYFVASYALFQLQPSLLVRDIQPESDYWPLHLSLRLPHGSTQTLPQPSQYIPKLRHRPERVA